MLVALLLATAAPLSAVEAEHAFAADAQKLGQWTAFRKWAAKDAVIFSPEPTDAQELLRSLKDPLKSVNWWPTASFVSCDGKMAVNTGGAAWPDGHASYFSTIWSRENGEWRWKLDHGDDLATPRPSVAAPTIRRADCSKSAEKPTIAFRNAPRFQGSGSSPDETLTYFWYSRGGRNLNLHVWLWNGSDWDEVLRDHVLARVTS